MKNSSLPPHYDVVILGGGPAGAAAAISLKELRSSLQVAIFEASAYEQWRAGEALPPGSVELLDSLGCGDSYRTEGFLESLGARAFWGQSDRPHEHEFLFESGGNGWHVDRQRFDAMLCECAQTAGVEVFRECRFMDARRLHAKLAEGSRWELAVREGKRRRAVRASFVVDATGRAASFAVRQSGKKIVADALTGVYAIYRFAESATPPDTYTLVESQEDGWWYSSLLPGSSMAVAWMSDADLIRKQSLGEANLWMEKLSRSTHTHNRVAAGQPAGPPRICTARTQKLAPVFGDSWLAVGDAASTLDPLSSMGIVKALRSAKFAAMVIVDYLDGLNEALTRYQELLDKEFTEHQVAKTWIYGLERRWPDSPFWLRRHVPAQNPAH